MTPNCGLKVDVVFDKVGRSSRSRGQDGEVLVSSQIVYKWVLLYVRSFFCRYLWFFYLNLIAGSAFKCDSLCASVIVSSCLTASTWCFSLQPAVNLHVFLHQLLVGFSVAVVKYDVYVEKLGVRGAESDKAEAAGGVSAGSPSSGTVQWCTAGLTCLGRTFPVDSWTQHERRTYVTGQWIIIKASRFLRLN